MSERLPTNIGKTTVATSTTHTVRRETAHGPALDRHRLAVGGELPEALQQRPSIASHVGPQLRGQRDTSGRCERFGYLLFAELEQGSLVDQLGLLPRARTSIMLARSTAWRQGEGRTSPKATSIRRIRLSWTITLAGLMSR